MKDRLRDWLAWWPLGLVVSVAMIFLPAALGPTRCLRITDAFHDMQRVEKALLDYQGCSGRRPTRAQGLGVLTAPADARCRVLREFPHDPWGNAYAYDPGLAGTFGGVYSLGIDGIDQHGVGDDVTTLEKTYRNPDYGLREPLAVRLAGAGGLLLGIASIVAGLLRTRL